MGYFPGCISAMFCFVAYSPVVLSINRLDSKAIGFFE